MSRFLRPIIRSMVGYVPGEQPADVAYLKLNTNECPYPPSPRVAQAIEEMVRGDKLRRYPDPVGRRFREAAGRVLDVDPESILIGNGSDDILTIITRAFVSEDGLIVSPTPSYLLYKTLAEIQGARFASVPFTADWRLPSPWPYPRADLTFVANPNSPSGTLIHIAELGEFASGLEGPLVIDEAYADFADENALQLCTMDNVIVTRTLSKSYGLAGIRFGFGIAKPELIRELYKVKDSYNCDVFSLAAATAAIEDQEHLEQTVARIKKTRAHLENELSNLGFVILPSQANFVWCQCSDHSAKSIYEALKRRRILVRYMHYDGVGDGLRITVGTDVEVSRLLEELRAILLS